MKMPHRRVYGSTRDYGTSSASLRGVREERDRRISHLGDSDFLNINHPAIRKPQARK